MQAVSPALAEGTCVCVLRMEIASFEFTNSLIYPRFESMKSLGGFPLEFCVECLVHGYHFVFNETCGFSSVLHRFQSLVGYQGYLCIFELAWIAEN